MALGNVARPVAGRAEARLLARSGLVAVLTLAAALRLGAPWLYHFQDDQALFLTIARPFLEGGSLPQHSVVFSVGVLTPPLVEYLLMIPLALSPSPELATAFMAALDVAAVGLCYWCGRRFLGAWGGLSAALLYAINPSVLLQVRKIQSHNFAPVFAALTLWGLYQLACTRRPAYLVAILAGYSALLQMHLAYLFYAPLVIGVLAVCWRAWRLVPVLIGSLLATLPWLPFVYFEVTHDFVNLHRALQFSSRPASWDADALRLVVTLVGGSGYLSQLDLGTSLTGATTPLDAAGLLEVALFLLGGALLSGDLARAVLSRVRARRACLASVPSAPSTSGARNQRAADHRSAALWFPLLTLAWALIPVLATLKHSILLLSHYYVAAFPALFLVVGAALQRCGTQCWAAAGLGGAAPWRASLPIWRMWMAGAATLCVALWQGVEFPLFVNAAAERGPWLYYGMAMGYSFQAAQLAQRVAGDGPIYLAAHHPLELPFNYLLWQRRPVKRFDVAHDLVLPGPNGPAVTYVVQEDRSDALAFLDRLLAGARRGRVLTPGGRPVYSIYRLTPEAAEEALRALKLGPVEATIGGVVALRGAQLDARIEPPGPARAVLYWEVAGDPARLPAEVTQFAHLVDNQWRGWGGRTSRVTRAPPGHGATACSPGSPRN